MHRSSLATLVLIVATAPSQAQSPSTDNLGQHVIERRAVAAVIWGMRAVNFELMLQFAVYVDGCKKRRPAPIRAAYS